MSYIKSAVKSSNFYSGQISCAASFSGDKDVTITSVDITKSFVVPMQTPSGFASLAMLCYGNSDNTNLTFTRTQLASATAFRFKSVVNADGGASHNINYAFMVVEFL